MTSCPGFSFVCRFFGGLDLIELKTKWNSCKFARKTSNTL